MAAIVVIDDRQDILEIVQLVLQIDKHSVRIFTDGQAALDALPLESCDLVFCDLNMPTMSGYTFVELLRLQERYQLLPIVALTAAEDLNTEKILAAGFTSILPKPFRADELKRVVAKHLA